MAEEKLLTIRDASLILGISEKEVIELAEDGSIPAYKIGGVYLRFKLQQLEEARNKLKLIPHKHSLKAGHSFKDKVSDFFYFNDFYILSILIITLVLWIIFQG